MNTYTVIAYIVCNGGHHVESIEANDGTEAAILVRESIGLPREEFEVVAVARGRVAFEFIDASQLALAPYSVTSP